MSSRVQRNQSIKQILKKKHTYLNVLSFHDSLSLLELLKQIILDSYARYLYLSCFFSDNF